ncbi:uncharacterized protein LOC123317166 [Coccinella septempunctata]|uniref:uncharacterized protein LOC123317166 n=1 Tax=Coccinella septempunctata TaxID=41139 RepID=UPI001D05E639|nr:uncharacterized protein LOC123317166 [Coccinella septempunctata]
MLVAAPYPSFDGPKIIAGIRKKDVIAPTPNIRPRLSGELLVKCGHEKNWWPRKVTVRGGHLVVSSRRTDDSLPTLRLPLRQLSLQAGPLVNSLALTKGPIIVLTIQTSTEQHFDLWVKAIAIELIRQTPLFAVKYLDILNLTEVSKNKEPDCPYIPQDQTTRSDITRLKKHCPRIVEMHTNDVPTSTVKGQAAGKVVEEKTVETILKKCQNVETYVPVKEKLVLFESLCRLGRKVRSTEDVSYKSDVETKRARSMHDLSNVGPHVAVREICKYFENKTDTKEIKNIEKNVQRNRLMCSEPQFLSVKNYQISTR